MRTFNDLVDDYLANETIVEKELTFCHSTKYKTVLNYILPDVKVVAHRGCEYHNDEKVVFIFYGKASYYPPDDQKDRYNKRNPPITFIYTDLFNNEDIIRLSCFDTGAFMKGLLNFDGSKPSESTLSEFVIENPSQQQLISGVQAIYKTNMNYLSNLIDPCYSTQEKPLCTCLVKVEEIYNDAEFKDTIFGPQAFTFELQIKGQIQSIPEVIVIPSSLAGNKSAIKQWEDSFPNSKIMIYEYKERQTIAVAYGNMRESVIEYNENLI